jgi:RNA polymerase sigma factor (sigma-70 family)
VAVDVVALDLPGGDPGRFLQHESDEALVRMISRGNTAAFETVYDRHHRGLLAFCRHLLSSKEEAEDALQHTFASAYRALTGDGTPPIALKPWLYTIARNRCLTVLRARRPHEAADDEQADATVVSGLADAVQQRADLRDLVSDLHRLPDDQRAALVLFEMGDHSHAEIAAVLSVSREKVKALVFQAREGLLRARTARDTPCAEIRRDLSSRTRALPRRGVVRGHLDRCPACAAFDLEVRRQRAALAIALPVVPSVGLKGSILGPMLGGGASIAGGGAVIAGSGAAGVGAGAAGLASAGGAAGGASVAAGGIGGGGGAVAAIASGASGLAGAGAASGLGALAAKTVVAKALTVVAVATAAAGTTEVAREVHAHHAKPHAPATSLASATPEPVLPDEPTTTVSLPATHTAVPTTTTTTTTSSSSQTATTATTSTPASAGGSTSSTGGGSAAPANPPSEPAADPPTGGTTAPPAVAADPTPANAPAPAPDPTPAASDPGTVDPGTVVSADQLSDPGTATDGTPSTDPNAPVTCPPGTEPAPTTPTDPAANPTAGDPATTPGADVTVDPLAATTSDPAGGATAPSTAADPAAAAAAAIASGLCVASTPGAQSAPDPAAGAVTSDAAAATAAP